MFMAVQGFNTILSDMCHNTSGIKDCDAINSSMLCGAAVALSLEATREGGCLLGRKPPLQYPCLMTDPEHDNSHSFQVNFQWPALMVVWASRPF